MVSLERHRNGVGPHLLKIGAKRMKRLAKLTLDSKGRRVAINRDYVVSVVEDPDEFTRIHTSDGHSHDVMQNFDQVIDSLELEDLS